MRARWVVLLVFLSFGLGLSTPLLESGIAGWFGQDDTEGANAAAREPDEPPLPAPSDAVDGLSRAFEHVGEVIRPSVVSISSVRKMRAPAAIVPRRSHPFGNSPFQDFFGDDFFERFFRHQAPPEGFARQGLGTGVIVDDEGHILTNHHVIAEADEITVRLEDEREFQAEVVGADPKTDLAVIRIDAEDLVPASLGDSDDLRIGQWVLAIGNPFGLSSTLTAGIVSATGRSSVGVADYEDFIQTDAAINPGNSGGPLVDLRGRVVGINTAIFSRSGGYMGIGFSIPVNMARSILLDLVDDGEVIRGWLGVAIQDLQPGLSKSFDFEGTDGVLVAEVVEDGPAEKGGLESGDIVTSYDGKPTKSTADLRLQVAGTRPGEEVEVEVFREGKARTVEVEIGKLEDGDGSAKAGSSDAEELGLELGDLTPERAEQLDLPSGVTGALVSRVQPFGVAARAGFRQGDVITSVDGARVEGAKDCRKKIRKSDLGEGVRVRIQRGSSKLYLYLQDEEH